MSQLELPNTEQPHQGLWDNRLPGSDAPCHNARPPPDCHWPYCTCTQTAASEDSTCPAPAPTDLIEQQKPPAKRES